MIAALICGRAENRLFPGRNTFPLLGRPLMVYPILAAAHASQVNRVFLSTDDAAMARVAEHLSVEVLIRDSSLSGADTRIEQVVQAGYREIVGRTGEIPEALVVVLVNAPTLTADVIDQGVDLIRNRPSIDAVMTVVSHNEHHPRYALRLTEEGLVGNYLPEIKTAFTDAFFPDFLLWVLRSERFFVGHQAVASAYWLLNPEAHRVAPLIHEGYGIVDYPWQIPAVEDWLRRRGFTADSTPYDRLKAPSPAPPPPPRPKKASPAASRVLITTVPFGQANPGPLNLLNEAGIEYVINPLGRKLKENELAELIRDFGVLIAGTEPITARVMDAAPHLRLISRVGIGLDNVDLLAARARGIQVAYTPDAPSPAVAELTIGLMIALLRDIPRADHNMHNGIWHRFLGKRLRKMTAGVIGVGRIGKRVIRHLAGGFQGVRILANDLNPDLDFGREYGVQWVDKESLYREADIITLHVPLTAQTRRMIGSREMVMMKPSVLLINTARGNMIVESDLAEALRTGRVGGAAIDVFGQEPYSGELSTLDRCFLTSHMGSMSMDCRNRMEQEAVEEAVRFLRNEPLIRPVPESEYQAVESLGQK